MFVLEYCMMTTDRGVGNATSGPVTNTPLAPDAAYFSQNTRAVPFGTGSWPWSIRHDIKLKRVTSYRRIFRNTSTLESARDVTNCQPYNHIL